MTATPDSMRALRLITGGDQQIARLKRTLLRWLDELFSGDYDREYVARRWQVGRRHVEIGLRQVFADAAMARIRQVPGVAEVEIDHSPNWLGGRMPRLESRIQIEVVDATGVQAQTTSTRP